ncbi:MAG: aromatic amino acid hydroxylase [Candidatus Zixiibacteriota bacterium]
MVCFIDDNRKLYQAMDLSESGSAPAAEDVAPFWESYDNENINKLPRYLKQFIVDQNYKAYTPINHSVWRYVMRQSVDFLKDNAHDSYLSGLKKTGLGIEKIPSIEEMNKILGKIGWAAVSVNGFIPPAAFMAFQAHKVLVIASDMRQLNHIEYTPSPDIIHEAAGHAPIIADEEYSHYLWLFGEIGSKAMSSKKDFELYEAIRKLSILKETPGVPKAEIDEAEKDVLYKQDNLGTPSEMALLSRLHWWTVEYGLIGDVNTPKIYGAGLLSSIGESYRCMQPKVKKLVYDANAADFAFDITTEQPQLFVTPDFKTLIDVLEAFAEGMAFRRGGLEGLQKAIESSNVATAVYSSGLQVSGTISNVITDNERQPIYLQLTGPSALAINDRQLDGHGRSYHKDGFGSPIGRLADGSAMESLSDGDLKAKGIISGKECVLEFASGVRVAGVLKEVLRRGGTIVLMSFDNCTVSRNSEVLFRPEWGVYDMAVGERITSVFSGAADKDAYEQPALISKMRTIRTDYTEHELRYNALFQSVRDYRTGAAPDDIIPEVWAEVLRDFPEDWLLTVEMVELLTKSGKHTDLRENMIAKLKARSASHPEQAKLIQDGLRLAVA